MSPIWMNSIDFVVLYFFFDPFCSIPRYILLLIYPYLIQNPIYCVSLYHLVHFFIHDMVYYSIHFFLSSFPFLYPNMDPCNLFQVQFDGKTNLIKEFQLDQIGTYPSIELQYSVTKERVLVTCEVIAEGPTRVLRIEQVESEREGRRRRESRARQREEAVERESIQVLVSVEKIGVSFVDEVPEELLFVTIECIELDYRTSDISTHVEFHVGSLQMDNQLLAATHPVLLVPFLCSPLSSHPRTDFFSLVMVKNNRSQSIHFIRYFSITLQEMDVSLDEILLLKLIQFVQVIHTFFEEDHDVSDSIVEEHSGVKSYSPQESRMLYFQMLSLNPIRVNVTFTPVSGPPYIQIYPKPSVNISNYIYLHFDLEMSG